MLYHLDAVDAAKARSKPTNAATDVEQRVHSLLQKAQEDKVGMLRLRISFDFS